MALDNLIMIPNRGNGIKFAIAQNKLLLLFSYLSGLKLKNKDIQANLTLNQPGNLDKY